MGSYCLFAHVFRCQVHAGTWVSRRIRKLDGPVLRAGNESSRCRPSGFPYGLNPRFRHRAAPFKWRAGVYRKRFFRHSPL